MFQPGSLPSGSVWQLAHFALPLKGLWTHTKGGFFHDGRFATLLDVMNHYDSFFHLGLTANEKSDVVEYLKSLADDVPSSVHHHVTLNATADSEDELAGSTLPFAGLSVWPLPVRSGRPVQIAFLSPSHAAGAVPADLRVGVYEVTGRHVASLANGIEMLHRVVLDLAAKP